MPSPRGSSSSSTCDPLPSRPLLPALPLSHTAAERIGVLAEPEVVVKQLQIIPPSRPAPFHPLPISTLLPSPALSPPSSQPRRASTSVPSPRWSLPPPPIFVTSLTPYPSPLSRSPQQLRSVSASALSLRWSSGSSTCHTLSPSPFPLLPSLHQPRSALASVPSLRWSSSSLRRRTPSWSSHQTGCGSF